MKITQELILQVQKAEAEVAELRKTIAEQIRAGTEEGAKKSEAEIARLTDKIIKEMERVRAEEAKAAQAAARAQEEVAAAAREAARALAEAAQIDFQLSLKEEIDEIAALQVEAEKLDAALEKAAETGLVFNSGMSKGMKEALKEAPGLFGDLGDAVVKLGGEFLGLNQKQVETAENTFELAEKFGQIGMTLGGPVGAGIGVAVGGFLALAKAATEPRPIMDDLGKAAQKALKELDRAKDARQHLREVKEAAREAATSLREMSEAGDIGGLVNDLRDLDQQLREGAKTIRAETGAALEAAVEAYKVQRALREENVEALKATLFDVIAEGINEINEAEADPKTLKEWQAEAERLDKELEKARGKLSRLKEDLDDTGSDRGDLEGLTLDIIKQKKAVEDLTAAKREADAAVKSGTESIKKEAEASKDAVNDALSPFLKIITQTADSTDDATDAMDRFVPGIKGASAALQRYVAAWQPFIIEDMPAEVAALAEQWNNLGPIAKQAFEMQFDAAVAAGGGIEEVVARAQIFNDAVQDLGMTLANAFAQHAVNGFNTFLDAVQDGHRILGGLKWDEALVNFLRVVGGQLIGEGIKYEIQAAAMLVTGEPIRAAALAGIGAAAISAGITMGAEGALLGRRRGIGSGGRDGGRESAGGGGGGGMGFGMAAALSARTSGPRDPGPSATTSGTTIINLQMLDPGDRESQERLGRIIARSVGAFRRAGGRVRGLFD